MSDDGSTEPRKRLPSTLSGPVKRDGLDVWTLDPSDDLDAARLGALGGSQPRFLLWKLGTWEFRTSSDQEVATLLTALRDMGVAFEAEGKMFMSGHIFELLREQGLVSGSYLGIWSDGRGIITGER